jgi:hypothetical protein
LAAGREIFRQMLRPAFRFAGLAMRGAKAVLGYSASGIARLRERGDAARIVKAQRRRDGAEDDETAGWELAPAFA